MTENKILKNIKAAAFFLSIFLITAVVIILNTNSDPDLWHRMAVGKIFAQTGWIIYHDIFSYLPTKEMWVDHEWLSGVIFYYLGHYFGDYGLLSLQISIVFLILFFVYKTNKLIIPEDKHRISYYTVILIAIYPSIISSVRCQDFTYLFFALWIYLLERIRRGENRFIWIFPVTMLLWANMHGGFLAGIGLIGFYLIGDFLNKKNISKYLWILGLCIPVTFINPYGVKYWAYLLDAVTMNRPFITEWLPLKPFEDFYTALGQKILFIFLICGYGFKLLSKNFKFDKVEIVAILITLYLSFKHQRHMAFFAIFVACYSYSHFVVFLDFIFDKIKNKISGITSLIPEDRKEQLCFAKECTTYLFLILISFYIISSTKLAIKMETYPVKAVEFIQTNNISGNLFVPFNWGSYAMWKLYPQNLISVDGRYEEAYTNQSYLDVCHFDFLKKDWKKSLNKYNHNFLLLRTDSDVYKKIKALPEWKIIYEDEMSAIFAPTSFIEAVWKTPTDDEDYYIKTKYKNRIDF